VKASAAQQRTHQGKMFRGVVYDENGVSNLRNFLPLSSGVDAMKNNGIDGTQRFGR